MSEKKAPVKLSKRSRLVFGGLLLATLLAEPFVHPHAAFGIDGSFGFHAWYGFVTCCAMVLVAKLVLSRIVSRPDDYYDA